MRSVSPSCDVGLIFHLETQQLLFEEATAADDSLREGPAAFLHEKHPKTTHLLK